MNMKSSYELMSELNKVSVSLKFTYYKNGFKSFCSVYVFFSGVQVFLWQKKNGKLSKTLVLHHFSKEKLFEKHKKECVCIIFPYFFHCTVNLLDEQGRMQALERPSGGVLYARSNFFKRTISWKTFSWNFHIKSNEIGLKSFDGRETEKGFCLRVYPTYGDGMMWKEIIEKFQKKLSENYGFCFVFYPNFYFDFFQGDLKVL